MGDSEGENKVFECDACGNVGLGRGEIVCCGEQMRPVQKRDAAISQPSLQDLLRTVFGMSDSELEICLCVMEAGEVTTAELAERIGYDRSVVARHLNHLADLEVIEKRRRLLEAGGHVYVYTPTDPATVRDNLRGQFLEWVRQASALVDDLRREKVESIVETDEEPVWKVFQE